MSKEFYDWISTVLKLLDIVEIYFALNLKTEQFGWMKTDSLLTKRISLLHQCAYINLPCCIKVVSPWKQGHLWSKEVQVDKSFIKELTKFFFLAH